MPYDYPSPYEMYRYRRRAERRRRGERDRFWALVNEALEYRFRPVADMRPLTRHPGKPSLVEQASDAVALALYLGFWLVFTLLGFTLFLAALWAVYALIKFIETL